MSSAATNQSRYSEEEWTARVELAACYRLFHMMGWHELIFNHISVKVPGTEHFLVNPWGLMYREVTASNLIKVDLGGNLVEESEYPYNPAAFIIHGAVHGAREDVGCIMHTHTTAGMAVACQKEGLLPLSFPAMFFTDRVSYHDFEGITTLPEECPRLAANLGNNNVMLLRNHGFLVCGDTIADAFHDHYNLQRACEIQIASQSAGVELIVPERRIAEKVGDQFERVAMKGPANRMVWDAMLRWVNDTCPGYDV